MADSAPTAAYPAAAATPDDGADPEAGEGYYYDEFLDDDADEWEETAPFGTQAELEANAAPNAADAEPPAAASPPRDDRATDAALYAAGAAGDGFLRDDDDAFAAVSPPVFVPAPPPRRGRGPPGPQRPPPTAQELAAVTTAVRYDNAGYDDGLESRFGFVAATVPRPERQGLESMSAGPPAGGCPVCGGALPSGAAAAAAHANACLDRGGAPPPNHGLESMDAFLANHGLESIAPALAALGATTPESALALSPSATIRLPLGARRRLAAAREAAAAKGAHHRLESVIVAESLAIAAAAKPAKPRAMPGSRLLAAAAKTLRPIASFFGGAKKPGEATATANANANANAGVTRPPGSPLAAAAAASTRRIDWVAAASPHPPPASAPQGPDEPPTKRRALTLLPPSALRHPGRPPPPDPPPPAFGGAGGVPPPWRLIRGTPHFAVDWFKSVPTTLPIRHWFLTHFHSDHYGGLGKSFSRGEIYCTGPTAKLCRLMLGLRAEALRVLPLDEPVDVGGVRVTAIEANHCPGACLLAFEPPDAPPVLHTGDFRASDAMREHPAVLRLRGRAALILDTTYCSPEYTFPPQSQVVADVVAAVRREDFDRGRTLFLFGAYTIGKERVYLEVARTLRRAVCVTAAKLRVLDCLGLPACDRALLTTDSSCTDLRVVPMGALRVATMAAMLKEAGRRYRTVVGFAPTGWSFRSRGVGGAGGAGGKRRQSGQVILYSVPYSEHSSFAELADFVRFFRPLAIIPSVSNDRGPREREMLRLLTRQAS